MNIKFFLYDRRHPVDANMPEWWEALPVRRPVSTQTNLPSISYGSYLTAVRDFLIANDDDGVCCGLSHQLDRTVLWEAIDSIDIVIQKHGAFYHPARVDMHIGAQMASFVVNVAISAKGQSGLSLEFDLLHRLNGAYPQRFIPAVYYQAVMACEEKPYHLPMFLGEWLNGFHEFHIHLENTLQPMIHVWHPNRRLMLGNAQIKSLYRQVAEILTYYYDLQTFEQIFPWHHGAGDFVVRILDGQPIVRLITVRGYSSLVNTDRKDPAATFDALLRFFIHLSLRTQIDRVDGTGDLIWADDMAVEGTLLGFFDGLSVKDRIPEMSDSVIDSMAYYLSRLSESDLVSRIEELINAYPSQSPEGCLMAHHHREHAATLFKNISAFLS